MIIDDGSHINDHVVTTFDFLFPKLAPGGIYVIEDTQTSYWTEYCGEPINLLAPRTMMDRFKKLADSINYREWKTDEPDYFERHVTGVHFYEGIIFIDKSSHVGNITPS